MNRVEARILALGPYRALWAELEARYAKNNYYGTPQEGLIRLEVMGRMPVIFTAPHSVQHWREGKEKFAEPGTGGLAELLARLLGGTALTVAGAMKGDANWDLDGPFKQQLRALLFAGVQVVDLHGMSDTHGVDINIGMGSSTSEAAERLSELISACAAEAHLSIAIDKPFDATSKRTITSNAQEFGANAVQLEIAASLRPGRGSALDQERLVDVLVEALNDQF